MTNRVINSRNKEEARRKYIDFLAGIGIEADVHKPKKKAALADAVTTAKAFLKLKEMDGGLLSDPGRW